MASNVGALLDKAEDPEKAIDDYMRSLNSDLGKVKAETASVLAEERRAKRALDDCLAEIRKLGSYAEKAVESGDDEAALKFLERKAAQAERERPLREAYDRASADAANMKEMQEKLAADIIQLEARRAKLKEKLNAAKAQQKLNSAGSPMGNPDSLFEALEEKANTAYNEAMAIAELRAGKKDDLDQLFAQYEKESASGTGTAEEEKSGE